MTRDFLRYPAVLLHNRNAGFCRVGRKCMISLAIVEDEDSYAEQLTDMVNRYQKERNTRIKVTRYTDGDEIAEN